MRKFSNKINLIHPPIVKYLKIKNKKITVTKKKNMNEPRKKSNFWTILMIALAVLGVSLISWIILSDGIGGINNVAVIEIKGIITGDKSSTLIGTPTTSSKETAELIKKADENLFIKAILVEINSPGGSAVASAEISDALKKTEKPVIAVIREIGASGGYWIASSTDKIFAHKLSMTGSIGVIGSYLEFAGLMDRYNITYRRLVAGKYKDTGSPYKEMTGEEEMLYQEKLDMLHDAFIEEVAANRKLEKAMVKKLAHGFIFLGTEAKEAGLIDEFGGIDEAKEYLEKELGITARLTTYKRKTGLINLFSEALAQQLYRIGLGVGEGLFNSAKANSYMQPAMT